MPIYKTIIAKTKTEAYNHLMKDLDHSNLQIIKEGKVRKTKRKFFRKVTEEWYEIQIARYSKEVKTANKELNLTHRLNGFRQDKLLKKNKIPAKKVVPKTIAKVMPANISKAVPKADFENLINQFQKKINFNPKSTVEKFGYTFHTDSLASKKKSTKFTEPIKKQNVIYDFLLKKDFSSDFAKAIADHAIVKSLKNEADFRELAQTIVNFIQTDKPVSNFKSNKAKKIIYFVGSTGVGKTTTLCKVASSFFVSEKEEYDRNIDLRVASFDIRRLMAISQLEKFTNILDISFNRLDKKDLLLKILNENEKKGIFLIDTSGISIKENDVIDETEDYLSISNVFEKEVIFCLNACQRYKDIKELLNKIKTFNITQVIITKTDESHSLGTALSICYENNFPLSYITNGQDIPNDIEFVTQEWLMDLLLEEWLYEKSN